MSEKKRINIEEAFSNRSMSRRKLLLGAAAVAATATAGSGSAFAAEGHNHSHHSSNKYNALIDSALDCIKTGQACIDHCIELFKTGDTSVADCADTVQEMLAMCTALTQMASYHSKYLPEVARICRKVCLDCEKECRKHAKKHVQCKACADSCKTCAQECKKLAA